MKRLKRSGLIGCLDGTGVTSENYKDKLMEKMEWIKVTDQLPKEYERVLAYGKSLCGSCHLFEDKVIEYCVFKKGEFEFGEYQCPFEPTHWTPLPSTPKDN